MLPWVLFLVAVQLFGEESLKMKEEEYRDAIALGIIGAVGGVSKRYKLEDILGVKDTYSSSPGGPDFKNLGQFVFALRTDAGATCLGQCTTGNNLNPWGLCCYMPCNVNSACAQNGCCAACGFSLGGSTAVYVALGSISGCGATLWRRIS